jgi:hypothetical protein
MKPIIVVTHIQWNLRKENILEEVVYKLNDEKQTEVIWAE